MYEISSSSSSRESSSSSSSCSSSCSSVSLSCSSSSSLFSSSSCSSSSSEITGFLVAGAGDSSANGSYCYHSEYSGRYEYKKWTNPLYWISYQGDFFNWVIQKVTPGSPEVVEYLYINTSTDPEPPLTGWVNGPHGTFPPPVLSYYDCPDSGSSCSSSSSAV